MKLDWYYRAAIQVAAAILAAAVPLLAAGGALTQVEVVNLVIVGLGGAVVFVAPDVPGAPYTKPLLSALTAAAMLLQTFLQVHGMVQHVTPAEWIQIVLAALGAAGVLAVPNNSPLAQAVPKAA